MKKLILNSFKNMLKYRHYLMCSMSPVSESGDKESEIHSVESQKIGSNSVTLTVSREEN